MSVQSIDLKALDGVICDGVGVNTVKLNNDIIWTKFKLKGKFEDGSFYFFKNMQLHLYKHKNDSDELAITLQNKIISIDENGFMSAPWGTDVSWEEKIDVGFDLREFDYLMIEGYTYADSISRSTIQQELVTSAISAGDAVDIMRIIVNLETIDNEMGSLGSYTGKYGDFYRAASASSPSDIIQANDAVTILRQVVDLDVNGLFFIDNTTTTEYILRVCGDVNNSRLFIDTSPFKGATYV